MPITIVEFLSLPSHRHFQVDIDGTHITVILSAEAWVVDDWIRTTYMINEPDISTLIVGLGVQWNLGDEDARVETLQLSVGCRCLVYHLGYSPSVPDSLREFLKNPYNTFVGFWNQSDRRKLERTIHCLEMLREPLDIRDHVTTADGNSLQMAPVKEIIEECLGISGVRMTGEIIHTGDWGAWHLSEEQVLQATLDAHCAFQIWSNIRAWKSRSLNTDQETRKQRRTRKTKNWRKL